MKINIDLEANVSLGHHVIGVLSGKNGCCNDKPYLLTVNKTKKSESRPDGLNYSCQCSCGGWCTNGHRYKGDAINEYEAMSQRMDK